MGAKPDALKALEAARETAAARAADQKENDQPITSSDLDTEECFVRLVIEMYASGLKVGMGVMPDGMAIYLRLSYPATCHDSRAGMVSFVVSNDTQAVLLKAVSALDAGPKSVFWKPDRFAKTSE